jgi:hypothetical protein
MYDHQVFDFFDNHGYRSKPIFDFLGDDHGYQHRLIPGRVWCNF